MKCAPTAMFRLKFIEEGDLAAVSLTSTGVPVQQWQGAGDAVCAYGYSGDGWWALEWPTVGTFRFGPALGESVEVITEPGVARDLASDVYRRAVLPLMHQAAGDETLHASAVISAHGALAFCGDRGAGKSTIAYALAAKGFEQCADDALVLKVAPGEIRTVPVPFVPKLRPASLQLLRADRAPRVQQSPHAAILAAVFVLEQSERPYSEPRVEPLAAGDGLCRLLKHAHCFNTVDPASRQRLLQNYIDIAAGVRLFSVTYRPGLERLEKLLDAILLAVATPG